MRKLLLCMALLSLGGCIALPPQHSANFSDCFYEQSKLAQCVNGSGGGYLKVQLTQPPGGITGNMPPWVGGNGSVGQILTSRGPTLAPTFQAAAGGGGLANPTASVGLTAVNGVAATGLRSDGAPALSLAIAPNISSPWTASPWAWSNAEPRLALNESDQGADLKLWDIDLQGGVLCLRTRTDADGAGVNALCVTRGATTATSNLTFGNGGNPSYTFNGSGTTTFNGGVVGTTITLTNFTLTGNIFKAPTTQSTGTKFTTSACSISSTTGGAAAGTFTLGANSCTAVVTMNGATGATATNGWTCQAHDRTAPTVLIGGESSSTTTTASFTIPAGAGATDVISYSCIGY